MRSHTGVILVPSSVRNEDFSILIQRITRTIELAGQEEWVDRVEWLRR